MLGRLVLNSSSFVPSLSSLWLHAIRDVASFHFLCLKSHPFCPGARISRDSFLAHSYPSCPVLEVLVTQLYPSCHALPFTVLSYLFGLSRPCILWDSSTSVLPGPYILWNLIYIRPVLCLCSLRLRKTISVLPLPCILRDSTLIRYALRFCLFMIQLYPFCPALALFVNSTLSVLPRAHSLVSPNVISSILSLYSLCVYDLQHTGTCIYTCLFVFQRSSKHGSRATSG